MALFAISVAAVWASRQSWEIGRRWVLVGVYLLFSIRWRISGKGCRCCGRYIGLRGPGLFHMIQSSIPSAGMSTRVRVAA
jgi:hypothetical protein